MFNRKPLKIILAAVLIIAVISVSAFAISNLLSARDVAEHLGESFVANSFDKQENEIESVTDKGYTVSFLGIVKGEKIKSNAIKSDCSYYVVSVASADGKQIDLGYGVIERAEEGLGEDESAVEPMPNPKEKWTTTN